ncbi:hypothetical protein BGX38DRAFT_1278238 [Terfezia claveryi]|nr:hypothetical protein BGX38DRAFT_1278238 [Terfezia claveryi]
MLTPKNLIQNSKTDLEWDTRDTDYTSWRNAIKDYCAQHSIRSWASASQNEKDALIIAARSLTRFRTSMRNRLAGGSESHQKALEALLQDCLKKHSETSKNLAIKHARKRAHAHENSDEEEDISDTDKAAGTAVAFWEEFSGYSDKDSRRIWTWSKLMFLPIERFEKFWVHSRPNPSNLSFPADYTGLHSDAEVKAFFRMSKIYPRNEYEDFAEDSDANVRNVVGFVGVGCLQETILLNNTSMNSVESGPLAGNPGDIKKEHKCLFQMQASSIPMMRITAIFNASNGQNYL